MYPDVAKRNYKGFIDGLIKVSEEGALFRGAFANGCKLGAMVSCASGCLDYMKENTFYFFGPMKTLLRLITCGTGAAVAMTLSMPFDTVRNRMHTMRPLPNGEMPYADSFDCFCKILKYECDLNKCSNFGAFIAVVKHMVLDCS